MGRELRLIIVDDSPEFVQALIAQLRKIGYAPFSLVVPDAERLSHALEHGAWDVVIADHSMPDFKAAGALNLIRSKGLDIPLILASQNLTEEVALAALRAGAHDYLLKPRLSWIGPVLERTLREARERRSRQAAEAALREMSGRALDVERGEELVVLCDARGSVTSCNLELIELLGYEREDVVGRNWFQYFVPREQRERLEEAFVQAVETGGASGLEEYPVLTLKGSREEVRWRSSVLVDRSGVIVGLASVGVRAQPTGSVACRGMGATLTSAVPSEAMMVH